MTTEPKPQEQSYIFRKHGSSYPGKHCSYCPKSANELCEISCGQVYDRLEAERAADGVIVTDHE